MSRPPAPRPADPTVLHTQIAGAADPTVLHTEAGTGAVGASDATVVHAQANPGAAGADGPATPGSSIGPVIAAAAIGGAVSLSLGVYGRVHSPTGETIFAFGFPTLLAMKAWFTTAAAALAVAQALTAAWMWGRLPGVGAAPAGVAAWHRWTGTLAFFFTLPVAYHCLWSLGFQDTTVRVLVHSLLGCAFYGALTAKLLLLRSNRLPGWTLPVAGGLLVAVLTGIWFTSSLWFFTTVGFPGF